MKLIVIFILTISTVIARESQLLIIDSIDPQLELEEARIKPYTRGNFSGLKKNGLNWESKSFDETLKNNTYT
jgi:hypothetical protein